MRKGGKTDIRDVSRRTFLSKTTAAAGALGLAPAVAAPFVSMALANTKALKIQQWSHFVPEYDKWIDGFVRDWGTKNGVNATIDHIPHLELPARAAAEVAAGAGHDIFGFNGSGGPHLFAKHTMDMTKLVEEIQKEARQGWADRTADCLEWRDEDLGRFPPTTSSISPASTAGICGTRSA